MLVWIGFNLVFLCVLAFFVITNVVNLKKLPRLGGFSLHDESPTVSVIVPARNEENNIEGCVSSLSAQDYGPLEIIVVNDNSTDETPARLSRMKALSPRLRVVNGLPLPTGWAGKNWACAQGVAVAQGDVLLFTDADTRHGPRAVSLAVAALASARADFLTAIVGQATATISEKLVMPGILVDVLAFSLCPYDPFPVGSSLVWKRPVS